MRTLQLNINKYAVSLNLPIGLDADVTTILAMAEKMNGLEIEDIVAKLAELGCSDIEAKIFHSK